MWKLGVMEAEEIAREVCRDICDPKSEFNTKVQKKRKKKKKRFQCFFEQAKTSKGEKKMSFENYFRIFSSLCSQCLFVFRNAQKACDSSASHRREIQSICFR
jgi:hypothetical protein